MANVAALIREIEDSAASGEMSTSAVLRKALIVATRLGMKDLKTWLTLELNGYRDRPDIPEYRHLMGEVKAFNPYRGLIPIHFGNPEMARACMGTKIENSIPELETMTGSDNDHLVVNYSAEMLNALAQGMPELRMMTPRKYFAINQIAGVVSFVRNRVLEEVLKIDDIHRVEAAIGGPAAVPAGDIKDTTHIRIDKIDHFHGVLGDVQAGNIQIGNYNSIHDTLKAANVSQQERNDIENILDGINATSGAERKTFTDRGREWLQRNGSKIGALASTIQGWFISEE